MATWTDEIRKVEENHSDNSCIVTTLYDLVAAVEDTVTDDEEAWVVPIVVHLLRAGHVRFLRPLPDHDCPWDEAAPSWMANDMVGVAV